MIKPSSLRTALIDALPHLKREPDKLLIFIDQGQVIATGARTLSFEYRYQLNVILTDYAESADTVIVALLAWAKRHQSELLSTTGQPSLSFEVDLLNHKSCDLSITLALTERVIVTQDKEGQPHIEHANEPVPAWEEV